MDGSELIASALQSCELRKLFRGVYARDSFVRLKGDVTGAFIVNQGDRGSKGTHWVCLFIQQSINGTRTCVFFDSLGRGGPDRYDITIPTTKRGSGEESPLRVVYNTKRYQRQSTLTCGQFCLFVLHWLTAGVSFPCVLKQFSSDFLCENEKIVRDFFLTLKKGLRATM